MDEIYENPIFTSNSIALLSKSAEHSRKLSVPNSMRTTSPGPRQHYGNGNTTPHSGQESPFFTTEIDVLLDNLGDTYTGNILHEEKEKEEKGRNRNRAPGTRPATAAGALKSASKQIINVNVVYFIFYQSST